MDRYRPERRRLEIIATEDMKKLVPTSRICINGERDTIYIYNGAATPAKAQYNLDDISATINGLKQKVVDMFEREFRRRNRDPEEVVTEWSGLLSDQILKQEEESDLEDSDEQRKKPLYLQKYTKGIPDGIPAAEAILLGGKPMWLQIVDGKSKLSEEISLADD